MPPHTRSVSRAGTRPLQVPSSANLLTQVFPKTRRPVSARRQNSSSTGQDALGKRPASPKSEAQVPFNSVEPASDAGKRRKHESEPALHLGDKTDTADRLAEAIEHLGNVDQRFRWLSKKYECTMLATGTASAVKLDSDDDLDKEAFRSLCLSILSQQVSGAAARAICARFIALFSSHPDSRATEGTSLPSKASSTTNNNDATPVVAAATAAAAPATDSSLHQSLQEFPSIEQVARMDVSTLRGAGLSVRKAEYVIGLAQAFLDGRITPTLLRHADNNTVKKHLVSLRGIGPWTADMFLMFTLHRLDVLPVGDLGIQRGMAIFHRNLKTNPTALKGGRYLSEEDMVTISEAWRPYRSIASWYMWRVAPDHLYEEITVEEEIQ